MTLHTVNSRTVNDSARCQHRTATGKRCRLRVIASGSGLCFRHASQSIHRVADADLRSALAGDLTEFQSAHAVNEFLSRLLLLLSENRISPRRGAVLAYVCNLLLRTVPVMANEYAVDVEEPRLDVTLPPPVDLATFQIKPQIPESSRS